MRWITPLLFLGAAAYVWHYNQTHASSKLLFPFLQALVDGTPEQLGQWSAGLFAGIGVLFAVLALRDEIRDRRERDEDG